MKTQSRTHKRFCREKMENLSNILSNFYMNRKFEMSLINKKSFRQQPLRCQWNFLDVQTSTKNGTLHKLCGDDILKLDSDWALKYAGWCSHQCQAAGLVVLHILCEAPQVVVLHRKMCANNVVRSPSQSVRKYHISRMRALAIDFLHVIRANK